MNIKDQIEQDTKQAMLAGNKTLVTTLRGLKSAILYAELAKGARDDGLPEEEVINILGKEAKKRQESAEMYAQGGSLTRSQAELAEKVVIEKYLPPQLSEEELSQLVSEVIEELGANDITKMGQVITKIKERTQGAAEGAVIAKIVKEKLV